MLGPSRLDSLPCGTSHLGDSGHDPHKQRDHADTPADDRLAAIRSDRDHQRPAGPPYGS